MRENSPAPSPNDQDAEEHSRHRKSNPLKNLGAVIGAAILVVGGGASYVTGLWSPSAEAHVRKHDDRSPDEKLDQVIADLAAVKAQQDAMANAISRGTTDIAVIKRQLGLDGLGAPPPDRIPLRTSRFGQ